MKILTKNQAEYLVSFKVHRKIRYDKGKYKPSIIGKEIPAENAERLTQENNIVWGEHRRDKDGPYVALFCIDFRKGSGY